MDCHSMMDGRARIAALLPAVLLLLLVPTANATGTCDPASLQNILTECAIAGVAMAALTAVAYMAAEATNNARIGTWSKTEIMQVFVSLVIAMLIISLMLFMCDVPVGSIGGLVGLSTPASLGGDATPIYNASMNYLGYLGTASLASMSSIRYNMAVYEVKTSFVKYVCPGTCFLTMNGYQENPFAGDRAKLAAMNTLLTTATISQLSIIFQMFVLAYVMNGLFITLLPLAIVIRSIPFMRQFGGALVGIFLALYIFYPAMIALDAFIAPGLVNPGYVPTFHTHVASWEPAGNCDSIKAPWNNNVGCSPETSEANMLSTTYGVTISEPEMNDLSPDYDIGPIIQANTLVFITAIFLPAVNFILVAAFGREASRLLGEEADISRLGQMI